MVGQTDTEAAHLEALREAGEGWSNDDHTPPPEPGMAADLQVRSARPGSLPGNRYVRVQRAGKGAFRAAGPGTLRATAAVPRARDPLGHLLVAIKALIVGNPLANERAQHERLTKVKALAVLSSDAISSNAYATGAMLSVLLAAGSTNFGVSLPIAGAIAVLFAMVVLSYRQTIKAYPKGGGSYIVASDNLGSLAGLIAGSSLMIDYVLTVAVSVVSGVAALTSMSPELSPWALTMDVGFIVIILLGNLRGIRESGTIFMLPSYAFIVGVYAMIVAGTWLFLSGGAHVHPPTKLVPATEGLSLFLILRAFASGCTALTGIEAISDGVPAFQPPEWRNARTTITTLGILAISMFVGITLLVHALGLVPNPGDADPTLISQLNGATLGHGVLYYYVQITTALILMLAANTAFSDFPRLAYFMARDSFLPRQFTHKGDRLSYSNGILVLAALATTLVLVFQGSFESLINLYVIGVFASFTLSQASMVKRWWTRREEGWRKGLIVNGSGAALTLVVLVITATTKFIYGAWLVVVLVPLMVIGLYAIRTHYRRSGAKLAPRPVPPPSQVRHTVLISAFDGGESLDGSLAYARTLCAATVVVAYPAGAPGVTAGEMDLPPGAEMVEAAQRNETAAILALADNLQPRQPTEMLTVVLPEAGGSIWHLARHWRLRQALIRRQGIAVAEIAPGLDAEQVETRHSALISVARLDLASLKALAYCRSLLRGRILGIHVAPEGEQKQARVEWEAWGNHLPLVTIDSPYRTIVAPIRAYMDALVESEGGETLTFVLPMVVPTGLLSRILHNHTANRLRRLLLSRPNTVVISVPQSLT